MVATLIFVLSSCLGKDDTPTTSECAIVSFSVGNITSDVTVKKYDSNGNAKDTIVEKTIAGSEIFFNIDHINGRIYTVDSLPKWTNVKRVVPSFSSFGKVYIKVPDQEDLYYQLTSGSDSVDFTKTVELICVSTDKTASRTYLVDIYKHLEYTDTLEWKEVNSDIAITGASKALYTDEKVFVFSNNANNECIVTFADQDDATTWSVPVTIPVDFNSVVLFNGTFYGIDADGYIYRSTPDQLASTWSKASDQQVERLLAADAYFLYAYDGQNIIGYTTDLSAWSIQGTTDLDMLPETSINSFAYTSKTNTNLQQVVMTGLSSENSKHGVSWYKTTSEDENINQQWAYIEVTPDNSFGLPYLENLSVTYYNQSLYAIGIESYQYKYLYRSDDNGITWHPQTEKYPLPEKMDAANGAASIVTVGKKLWIIQENGKVWKGSIQ